MSASLVVTCAGVQHRFRSSIFQTRSFFPEAVAAKTANIETVACQLMGHWFLHRRFREPGATAAWAGAAKDAIKEGRTALFKRV